MIGRHDIDTNLGRGTEGDATSSEELIGRRDVARAVGVAPQAISNWAARHRDFPNPVARAGAQFFSVAAIGQWLDRRTIPTDRLQPDEARGATYGARFRNAVGLPDTAADKDQRTPVRSLTAKPWTELGNLLSRGDEPAAVETEVLALLCMRIVDPAGWKQLVAASHTDIDAVKRARGRLPTPVARATAVLESLAASPWRRVRLVRLVHSLFTVATPQSFAHLLDHLATRRGGNSGDYLVPTRLASLMVAMVDPRPGDRVHDPCCGYGALLVATSSYLGSASRERDGRAVFTGRAAMGRSHVVATMNFAVHRVRATIDCDPSDDLGVVAVDTGPFDVVLLNPPFGRNAWRLAEADSRWQWPYGEPPLHSVAFAWLQAAAEALGPDGRAAVVMPASSTSPSAPRERGIRARMLNMGVIRCVVELPGHLFRETAVPVTVWVLGPVRTTGDRDVLLIDGRAAAERVSPTHRELTERGCDAIVELYRDVLRGGSPSPMTANGPTATTVDLAALREHGYDLRPSAYLTRHRSPAAERSTADLRELTDALVQADEAARSADRALDEQMRRLAQWTH